MPTLGHLLRLDPPLLQLVMLVASPFGSQTDDVDDSAISRSDLGSWDLQTSLYLEQGSSGVAQAVLSLVGAPIFEEDDGGTASDIAFSPGDSVPGASEGGELSDLAATASVVVVPIGFVSEPARASEGRG